ncbi:MAG: DUF3426 domain-containing protein [Methylococcales bacterium]
MAAKTSAIYTKCSKCQMVQSVRVAQLRKFHGVLKCSNCAEKFDALEYLSETAKAISPKNPGNSQLWWPVAQNNDYKSHWFSASVAAGLLFVAQLLYFESNGLVQKPGTRVWLENICHVLHCRLPAYRNLHEFSVLQGQLSAAAEHMINFKTAISNQAAFAQNYPKLKLTLLDYAGNVFAQRIFQPQEYLGKQATQLIQADAGAEINLTIVEPKKAIGGYTFDLTN